VQSLEQPEIAHVAAPHGRTGLRGEAYLSARGVVHGPRERLVVLLRGETDAKRAHLRFAPLRGAEAGLRERGLRSLGGLALPARRHRQSREILPVRGRDERFGDTPQLAHVRADRSAVDTRRLS
jgi:hypothetical protein